MSDLPGAWTAPDNQHLKYYTEFSLTFQHNLNGDIVDTSDYIVIQYMPVAQV